MKRRSFLQLIGATVAGFSLPIQAGKSVSGRYMLTKHGGLRPDILSHSGTVVYALITNSEAEVFDGKNFVCCKVKDWHKYCLPCHEPFDGVYTFSRPSGSAWPNGTYVGMVYEQIGATPAQTDKIIGAERERLLR